MNVGNGMSHLGFIDGFSKQFLAHTSDHCWNNIIDLDANGISDYRVYRRIESASYDPLYSVDNSRKTAENAQVMSTRPRYKHRSTINFGEQR
jgi:hypothetical protein